MSAGTSSWRDDTIRVSLERLHYARLVAASHKQLMVVPESFGSCKVDGLWSRDNMSSNRRKRDEVGRPIVNAFIRDRVHTTFNAYHAAFNATSMPRPP
jgi:hypothetical protein